MPNVVFGHAFGREALLKPRADAPPLNLIEVCNSFYGFGFLFVIGELIGRAT